MKKSPGIKTVESQVLIPVSLLEAHVNSMHHPRKFDDLPLMKNRLYPDSFENIQWCTEELEVDGLIEIHLEGQGQPDHCVSIPVSTCLLVVCTKGSSPIYKMTWSCPLS
jgi:hypothetical protein